MIRTPFFFTGLPRSGGTLLVSMLRALGVSVVNTELDAFWLSVSARIHGKGAAYINRWMATESSVRRSVVAPEEVRFAIEQLPQAQKDEPWAIYHPYMMLYLSTWRAAFAKDLVPIVLLRHPHAVMDSLHLQDDRFPDHHDVDAFDWWLNWTEECSALSNPDIFYVHFDKLCDEPATALMRLFSHTSDLPACPTDVYAKHPDLVKLVLAELVAPVFYRAGMHDYRTGFATATERYQRMLYML